jgi:Rps23 Pro-64 3,4-dihydroxylase Tpa1-like proline 4-hydroxylase
MEIKCHNNQFPYVTISNTYDNNELKDIWEELIFLFDSNKFIEPNEKISAVDGHGEYSKNNLSAFLDDIYSNNRKQSKILNTNRKIFTNFDLIFNYHSSWFFKNFKCSNDYTLMSYYENGGFYKPHKDSATVTVLTWFYKEPRKFLGGDLYLTCNGTTIKEELQNNKTVIFPSMITHSVSEVKMGLKDQNEKFGRFCMTQFLH